MHPIQVLENYWNYTSFKPLQEDIINSVLDNKDTFALLPTGGGKSLCFQIPALIKPGICIVVSPLVALMKDQVHNLKQKGIKAMSITSGISYQELDTQLNNCIYGKYKFLYISPERLQQTIVQERIQQMPVNLIAVDEAHCISQWGNDFRPAYKNIVILRQLQPSVNCIALTATAKSNVINDTIEALDFIDTKLFKASFKRENISYQIIETEDKHYELERILKTHHGSGIIYVRSRNACNDLHSFLAKKGISSTYFHGGISSKEKAKRLQQWTTNHVRIMVATTAFGMGIDKPDVETVIHYNLPESLESYYQEAGRAGRNDNKAYAILLKKPADEAQLKAQFLGSLPDAESIKYTYRKLLNYFQISYGEGEQTTHQLQFKEFCATYNLKATVTYNVLQILDRNSVINFNQQFNYKTKIQFLVSNTELFHHLETHKSQNTIIKALLRTYGGIFDYQTKVNLDIIANKAQCTEKQLFAVLKDLEKQEIISLDIANSDTQITFIQPREDDKTINPIMPIIRQQQDVKKQQIEAIINFTNNNRICKSEQLLHYFEETKTEPCGICSVCISNKKSITPQTLMNDVLTILQDGDKNSRTLQGILSCDSLDLMDVLKVLMEKHLISITSKNTYKINDN